MADQFSGLKVFVAGHRGMVGSALLRSFDRMGVSRVTRSREELDLLNQTAVNAFFRKENPDLVVVAAARVGGIEANRKFPAMFAYENLMIGANLIHASHQVSVKRLLFLGSSCIYPKFAEQPIQEESLLSGSLEPTNEAYAIAKIAGVKLCEYYRKQYGCLFHSAMPCNLYGPGDNYHPENSHVIPGLIRRFHEAKESGKELVTIWGSGTPRREFLHVDDLADACLHLLQVENPPDRINVGSGEDLPISDLAVQIADAVGFEGKIETDPSKPDGTPRKLMDSSKMIGLGWSPAIKLDSGLRSTYADFLRTNHS